MECNDKDCPVHGNLRLRGQILSGKVVSTKAKKTAIVEIGRVKLIRKYKRYAKTKSKIAAHNPPCIDAKEGDNVRIMECRKISRTKAFCIFKRMEE